MNYVVNEINGLIFIGRFIDIKNESFNGISNKIFSRKLGIISHYLTDFVTRPHYDFITFTNRKDFIYHRNYERSLRKMAQDYDFRENDIQKISLPEDDTSFYLRDVIRDYLEGVLAQYGDEKAMDRDLSYAYNLNNEMTEFVLDTIEAYNDVKEMKRLIVFK